MTVMDLQVFTVLPTPPQELFPLFSPLRFAAGYQSFEEVMVAGLHWLDHLDSESPLVGLLLTTTYKVWPLGLADRYTDFFRKPSLLERLNPGRERVRDFLVLPSTRITGLRL